ncbi:MAG: hypothetical protein ACTSO7_07915 [Candidatus Heimdallarchaeota archaeon]
MPDKAIDIKINREKINKGTRKGLIIGLVLIVAFGLGSLSTYLTMRNNHIEPHNKLEGTNYYCRSIISSFETNVYSESEMQSTQCNYEYNEFSDFLYNPIYGDVDYIDEYLTHPEYEIMRISIGTSGYSFQDITFQINSKVRLSLAIFADGEIVYSSNLLKNDISLTFTPRVELIELYFF